MLELQDSRHQLERGMRKFSQLRLVIARTLRWDVLCSERDKRIRADFQRQKPRRSATAYKNQ